MELSSNAPLILSDPFLFVSSREFKISFSHSSSNPSSHSLALKLKPPISSSPSSLLSRSPHSNPSFEERDRTLAAQSLRIFLGKYIIFSLWIFCSWILYVEFPLSTTDFLCSSIFCSTSKVVNFGLPVLVNFCADRFPLTSKASDDYSTNKASDFLFYEHYQSVSN
jgi:hypothetical protein